MYGWAYSSIEQFDDERSLKSRIRSGVLLYLYTAGKAGKKVTAYEIAKDTGICYPNVRGALTGLADRLSWMLSLVYRGMVTEETTLSGSRIYSITEKGRYFARAKLAKGT